MAEIIIDGVQTIDAAEFSEKAYEDYAFEVILERALADVRDGLAPVHRRILYAMWDMGLRPGTPHRKSARVVGEVLGKYHPHGDQSVYGAMVRLAQSFNVRYPLVDGQGNFGNIDGSDAAAMRYTEARLTPLAAELMQGIQEDTVPWQPNFDESLREPVVLPTRFPQLLINGHAGIAVGMSASIPSHNMGEIMKAVIYIASKWKARNKITPAQLMKIVPGPDLPTGGVIYRYQDGGGEKPFDAIKLAYKTGRSKLRVAAKIDTELDPGGRWLVVVSELPYGVKKTTIIEQATKAMRETERLKGVAEVIDESDRNGLRVVFEIARGYEAEEVMGRILKYTDLIKTLSYNFMSLVREETGIRARELSLLRALEEFIAHRLIVITRRSEFRKAKAEARLHIIQGLLKTLANIEEIVEIIKKSRETAIARVKLMKKFKLSEIQTDAILNMPLRRLVGADQQKLKGEEKDLKVTIRGLKEILGSEAKQLKVVVEESTDIIEKFGDERRTVIMNNEDGDEEIVTATVIDRPDTAQVISVTSKGVLRVDKKSYKNKTKAGVWSSRATTVDRMRWVVEPDENFVLVTSEGRIANFGLGDIDSDSPYSSLGLVKNEKIVGGGVLAGKGMVLAIGTVSGMIKTTKIEDISPSVRWSQGIGFKDKNDKALFGSVLPEKTGEVFFWVHNPKAPRILRFSVGTVNPQASASAKGVAGIKINAKDVVLGGAGVVPTTETVAVVVSKIGFAKQVPLKEIPSKGRATQGMQILGATKATGEMTALGIVSSKEVEFITNGKKRLRLGVASLNKTNRQNRGELLPTLPENALGPPETVFEIVGC